MSAVIDRRPVGSTPAGYPPDLERSLELVDGLVSIHIRPIVPDDAERLIDLYARLSPRSAYQRFFAVLKRLPPEWARDFANLDYVRRLALVAEHDTPDGPELMGVARYEPSDEPNVAEVAVVVQDRWQGQGLGSALLADLLAAARARGIVRFCAYVLAGNSRMLKLLARATQIESRALDSGVVAIVFTPRAVNAETEPRLSPRS